MTLTVGPNGEFTAASEADQLAAMETFLGKVIGENFRMQEMLGQVELMIDERGWQPIYEYGADQGLTLAQVKRASRQLRELVVGNPFVKRGFGLRGVYTWAGGLDFALSNLSDGKPQALSRSLTDAMRKPANRRYLFSNRAHMELERAVFTDGSVFLVGNKTTKTVQRVPVSQIAGDLRNPDNLEEIWAYRRVWYQNPDTQDQSTPTPMVRWYFTPAYTGKIFSNIQSFFSGEPEAVDVSSVMIAQGFNTQVGWAYGIPDSLAIIAWSRLYKEFLMNGYIMSRALARLAYKVTTSTLAGSAAAQAEMVFPGQAGSTAVQGQGNQLESMPTAGKGYDFNSGQPLAQAMASGLEISVNSLLGIANSDGGTQLDPAIQLTAAMRRLEWDDFWGQVFDFFGNTSQLAVTWHDLPVDMVQRQLQAWTLLNNTGYFGTEVVQRGMAAAMSIHNPGSVPDGAMLPNNRNSIGLLPGEQPNPDAPGAPAPGDTQTPPPAKPGTPKRKGSTGSGGSTGGSGQGRGTGSGKSPNDHNTD